MYRLENSNASSMPDQPVRVFNEELTFNKQ